MYSQAGAVCTHQSNVKEFEFEIQRALQLVSSVNDIRMQFGLTIKALIPVVAVDTRFSLRKDGSGRSSHWLKGGVFLSLPENFETRRINLALNVVHELGHQVLMVLQDCDDILVDINEPIYSSIRKERRPAIMSYHALVATYYMLFFCMHISRSLLTVEETRFLSEKYLELRSAFFSGAFAMRNAEMTSLGFSIFDEMFERVSSLEMVA